MNKTQCPLSPPAPLELPFAALAQIAPNTAALMERCHVAEYVFPADSPHAGRTLILTAPQPQQKKG